MSQQKSKLISASTGHDCAAKRIESAALAKQVAAFLKAGGKVKTVEPVRPVNNNIVHGTRYAYVITQCRCGKCTKWHNSRRVGAKGVAA